MKLLHEKIMYRLTQSPIRQHIGTNNLRKYISVAACATVMLFFIIGVYPHMNIWNTNTKWKQSEYTKCSRDPNPRQDKLNTIEQSSVVYHDVDASQLIR